MSRVVPHEPEPTRWFRNDAGEVLRIEVPAPQALASWTKWRGAVSHTGRWPVLIGSSEGAERVYNLRWNKIHVARDLRAADGLAGAEVLRETLLSLTENVEDEEFEPEDLTFDPATLVGENQEEPGVFSFEREKSVILALLPTPNGWEAPAHFGYGGWNGYPNVPEHVATLRHFQERYEAELAVLSYDTVELLLADPIRDPSIVKQAAIEWYAYSPDNVDQGVGSVRELANAMLGTRTWFSWWD